jgi:heme A synthase
MRQLRTIAFVTAGFAYALIVLGAVVRITGSGMGCGDDWPLCHGRLFPSWNDVHGVIEWSHRAAVAGGSLLIVALAGAALIRRKELGVSGGGGPLRPILLATALVVLQALLGAAAVKVRLRPWVVTLHLATALALLASVLIAALRAGYPAAKPASAAAERGARAAVALAGLTLLLGGLTASRGAGFACQGFPLCSGRWWPPVENGLAVTQWAHRLAAYGLLLHLIGFAVGVTRRGEPPPVPRLAWATLGVALLQLVVAIVMVSASLRAEWRALHAAAGTAVWGVVVWLAARTSPSLAGRAWPRETR